MQSIGCMLLAISMSNGDIIECNVREGLKGQTAWQQSSRGAQTDPGRIPDFKNRPVMTDSLHRQVSRLSEPGLCNE